MGKGSRAERELFKKLWNKGYGVIRSPASGSRKEPQPDLLCSNGREIMALELKKTEEGPVYVGKEEVDKLKEFCKRFSSKKFSAVPLIGIRRNFDNWQFHHPRQAIETKKSYKFEKSMENIDLLEMGK